MRDRLLYLAWKLRGRGLVRLHIPGHPTVEGVLLGCRKGHYLLLSPRLLADDGEHRVELAGSINVPRERVLFVQEL